MQRSDILSQLLYYVTLYDTRKPNRIAYTKNGWRIRVTHK
jgi:hypothetical protein